MTAPFGAVAAGAVPGTERAAPPIPFSREGSPGGIGHRFGLTAGGSGGNDVSAELALVTLTLAGVFSMNRLFVGHSFAGPVILVAVGTHVVAWAVRRMGWPPVAAALASVAALILLTAWAVLPSSTTYGLPLLHTLHVAGRSVHQARLDFHRVTAPAPVTQGFVLVSACGVGILALLADWAAFRMRATLEATVPSFALFIFCAVIGSRGSRTQAVVVEVAALVAFVVIHQAAVDRETSAWFANRTAGVLKSTLWTGGLLGLAALIVALNLGLRLPGATKKALIGLRGSEGGAGTRSTQSPLVDLRGRLLDPSPNPVFTVVSNQPEYWRQTSLDTFNGTDWNALGNYRSAAGQLGGGTTPTVGGVLVQQNFSITSLNSPWLPAAYRPTSVNGIKGITYDPQSGSLISNNNSLSGVSYHVTSEVSTGADEAARLEAAAPAAKATVAQYLQLPKVDDSVIQLANQIVAGKATDYDKAIALQTYLRDPSRFTYNLSYNYVGPDPLAHFLFDARQGYCQQFAGSFAVLARVVGLPTRLAVGWTWGSQVSPGTYQVTDQQAHTWPEVYFTGVGWVPFEPTPGRGIPGAQNYTGVAPVEAGDTGNAPGSTASTVPSTTTPGQSAQATTPTTNPRRSVATTKAHHGNPWLAVLLWLGGAISALALLMGAAVALRWLQSVANRDRLLSQASELESEGTAVQQDRFARFRAAWSTEGRTGAGTLLRRIKAIALLGWLVPVLPWRSRPAAVEPEVVTRAELLLSWSEVTDLLAWWGVRRLQSETYRELAHRAARELRGPLSLEPTAVNALLQLADVATKAEFGLGSMTPQEAEAGAGYLATVKRALLGSATGTQRMRLAIDPRFSVKVR